MFNTITYKPKMKHTKGGLKSFARLWHLMLPLTAMACFQGMSTEESTIAYKEIPYPTPNVAPDSVNEVLGIILHHTALPSVEYALAELTRPRGVSSHCVIDTNGTRYILAPPTAVTFHAGKSVLNGREKCNAFTIGVEFQGNTVETPLTDNQIQSGVEYLLPIIREYHIPLSNIVTHQMVRDSFMVAFPNHPCKDKVDITRPEYERVMAALKGALGE